MCTQITHVFLLINISISTLSSSSSSSIPASIATPDKLYNSTQLKVSLHIYQPTAINISQPQSDPNTTRTLPQHHIPCPIQPSLAQHHILGPVQPSLQPTSLFPPQHNRHPTSTPCFQPNPTLSSPQISPTQPSSYCSTHHFPAQHIISQPNSTFPSPTLTSTPTRVPQG